MGITISKIQSELVFIVANSIDANKDGVIAGEKEVSLYTEALKII